MWVKIGLGLRQGLPVCQQYWAQARRNIVRNAVPSMLCHGAMGTLGPRCPGFLCSASDTSSRSSKASCAPSVRTPSPGAYLTIYEYRVC